jgi:valyl-tRNA synthetase
MTLSKRYNPAEEELRLQAFWQEAGIYQYHPEGDGRPVYSIDSPPATVSGHLHLGHVYSYSHPDFMARYFRMRGYNVFYPMGYDDNGIPTERLVEKWLGVRAIEIGRQAFIEKCLQVSEEEEENYQALWQRLGLSIDWRYSYRTIDAASRRTSQLSFMELYKKGLAYRQEAPTIWCPECRTAVAQAELEDLERDSEFVTLPFELTDEEQPEPLRIATTRPELLPACVAVFVHPEDDRYRHLIGHHVKVPLFHQEVPVLADRQAEPEKGTGAVMCCTFGDTADVAWWYTHKLPLVEAIDRTGKMTATAGAYQGMPLKEARQKIKTDLEGQGLLLDRQPTRQSVRVHERCDTPVEYIITRQWFIKVLDQRPEWLQLGERVHWHPEHMESRYRAWVENLNWDWCISRQRYFGVPFPVWYCAECGEVILAEENELPVDPTAQKPPQPCTCGSREVIPEEDIFDTWMTSSMTPQIVGRWLEDPDLYQQVFPFSLRPSAHEIIRTWEFYTIVKSQDLFASLPWTDVLISGWGIAGEGMGKISKSRGGGPMPPMEMIQHYSADAVRYWAASTSPGKDSVISEEKIQNGAKLVTKLWNVAKFSSQTSPPSPLHIHGEGGNKASNPLQIQEEGRDETNTPLHACGEGPGVRPYPLSPADAWILSRLQNLILKVTKLFDDYDYAAAKSEVEGFFWGELTDNYLEMCKQRLYGEDEASKAAARWTLDQTLLAVLKLFAPFLPYVTEAIYQELYREREGVVSIHITDWPQAHKDWINPQAEAFGDLLVEIATTVRRYKSEHNLSLGTELDRLQLATGQADLIPQLKAAIPDLTSITRAKQIDIIERPGPLEINMMPVQPIER